MSSATSDVRSISGHNAPGLPAPSPEHYNQFLRTAQLESIEQLKLSAERSAEGVIGGIELSVTPEFAVDDERAFFRYDAVALITGTEGESLGSVSTVVALAFLFEGDQPSEETLGRFGLTTGMLVAHPYVREALQSLAARVGFPQLVVPLVPVRD